MNDDYDDQLKLYEEEKRKLKEMKLKLHPKKKCKYCGEKPDEHHHCSGKKAYQKGFEDGLKENGKKAK